MNVFIAVGLGVLIGLLLGALGGGGSILTVPVLVYLLDQSPQGATSSSLVIVGVTSAVSAVNHARSGRVRWGTGVAFAAAGVVASFAGTALNSRVDGQLLLLAFAAVMVVSSVSMLWRTRPRHPVREPAPALSASGTRFHEDRADVSTGDGADGGVGDRVGHGHGSGVEDVSTTSQARGNGPLVVAKVVGAGLVVGFLTGFLGVGGGFVIVPALVAALGFAMPAAVGTSLVIIALNSAVSLTARAGSNHFDWAVIIPFALAAVAGSFLGKTAADRLPARRLTRIFAVLLLVVAAYVVTNAL